MLRMIHVWKRAPNYSAIDFAKELNHTAMRVYQTIKISCDKNAKTNAFERHAC